MSRDPRIDFAYPITPNQRQDLDLSGKPTANYEGDSDVDRVDQIARQLRGLWHDEARVVEFLRGLPPGRIHAAGRAMRTRIRDERSGAVWLEAFPNGPELSPAQLAPTSEQRVEPPSVAELLANSHREALADFLEGRVLARRGHENEGNERIPKDEGNLLFSTLLGHSPTDVTAARAKLDARQPNAGAPSVATELESLTRGIFQQHTETRRLHQANPALSATTRARTAAFAPIVQQRAQTVFRRAVSEVGAEVDSEDPRVKEALSRARSGQELPEAIRQEMEGRFGISLSGVRVHTDSAAAAAGEVLHAEAFTVGDDVFFGAGKLDWSGEAGRKLLVHELTHVVQHYQGRTQGHAGNRVSQPADALEREAEHHAHTPSPMSAQSTAAGVGLAPARPVAPAGSSASILRKSLPGSGGIVYLGLNPEAQEEARLLRSLNGKRNVAAIVNSHEAGHVRVGSQGYDLSNEAELRAYVETLGLSAAKADRLVALLTRVKLKSRDEMGRLAATYANVEQGRRGMQRVVFSGESSADVIWGDDNGSIQFSLLIELSKIFPSAVGQVRDLMVSACYSGLEAKMAYYHEMFPNIQSIWAYARSSPGTNSGAQEHIKIWDRATKGAGSAHLHGPATAQGTRKGENVATWTSSDGYQGGAPVSVEEADAAVRAGEPLFRDYLFGHAEVADPQSGPLRNFYNNVQRLLGNPGLDAGRMAEVEGIRDLTIRLLFFAKIRVRFATSYAAELRQGYSEIGQAVPDYAKLGRGAAIEQIDRFTGHGPAKRLLESGLKGLQSSIILPEWI